MDTDGPSSDTSDPSFWDNWDDWEDRKDRICTTFPGWESLPAIERCLVAHASTRETLSNAIGYFCGHPAGQRDWMFRLDGDRIPALIPDFSRAVTGLTTTGRIMLYELPSAGAPHKEGTPVGPARLESVLTDPATWFLTNKPTDRHILLKLSPALRLPDLEPRRPHG
jgi:hypothetical protein